MSFALPPYEWMPCLPRVGQLLSTWSLRAQNCAEVRDSATLGLSLGFRLYRRSPEHIASHLLCIAVWDWLRASTKSMPSANQRRHKPIQTLHPSYQGPCTEPCSCGQGSPYSPWPDVRTMFKTCTIMHPCNERRKLSGCSTAPGPCSELGICFVNSCQCRAHGTGS